MGAVMRLAEWSHNLDDFIDSIRDKPFAWGSNDCMTFSNQAVKAMTGRSFADDWLGEYATALSAKRHYLKTLKENDADSIVAAIDKRLERIDVAIPPRGSLVGRQEITGTVTGLVLGICTGEHIAFISDEGVIFLHPQARDIFWKI